MDMVGTGYHIKPTDQEILCYLMKKARGEPLPSKAILEDRTLYGKTATPWEVFFEDDSWEIDDHGKKIIYAFARLSTVSATSKNVSRTTKNVSRTAGNGTWSGQTAGKEILNNKGQLIGRKKMFTFAVKDGSLEKGHWIMHDYSLDGVSLEDEIIRGKRDYVVCRVTLDEPKSSGDNTVRGCENVQENPRVQVSGRKRVQCNRKSESVLEEEEVRPSQSTMVEVYSCTRIDNRPLDVELSDSAPSEFLEREVHRNWFFDQCMGEVLPSSLNAAAIRQMTAQLLEDSVDSWIDFGEEATNGGGRREGSSGLEDMNTASHISNNLDSYTWGSMNQTCIPIW